MILTLVYGAIVGLSLGLTGGGGSIFAVPLLVYGLGLDFRQAAAVSLAVVGLTSLYGAVLQARRRHVLWGAGVALGCGGVLAAPLGAWIGAQMPEKLSLLLFAVLMIFISGRMLLRKADANDVPLTWIRCQSGEDGLPRFTFPCAGKLLVAGMCTGVLSGIFGVGGGFLVVPALLLVTCVSIERALATSLVGIFLIAMAGLASNAHALGSGHSALILRFLVGSALGMTVGAWLKGFATPESLQRFFGFTCLALRSL